MKERLVERETKFHFSTFKTILSICFLVILGTVVGGAWTFLSRAAIKKPRISIVKQSESPLYISAESMRSTDALKPTYDYLVTNVSDRAIRAYAIRNDATFGNEKAKMSGVVLSHLVAQSMLLQPGHFLQHAQEGNATFSADVSEIVLSVDFVEFADGTTWGVDEYKSAENLAGQRAGGKAAIDYFRDKLKSGGIDALTTEVEKDNVVSPNNSKASSNWERGFRTGVGIVRNRLFRATNNAGL